MRGLLLLALFAAACRGQGREDRALREMVDELLPRLEVLSGLPALEPIQFGRQSRAEMRVFVETQLREELPPEELAGMQAAYAALGLLPADLDLRALLVDLYTEQVVGYYHPRARTFFLVEGASVRESRPVLAHELVHALQDQHANLDSLVSRDRGNDRQTAAQAAIEGHATLVMFALLLEEQGGGPIRPGSLPDIGAQLLPILEAQNEQFPVFRNAPRIIRETVLFPYIRGAAFVQAFWNHHEGMPAPFGAALPQSTEQILHPATRFLDGPDRPTELEWAATDQGWRTLYETTLGQFETGILLEEHLGRDAGSFARGWDGDRLRLMEAPDGGHALAWYSVWDSPTDADRFAEAYQRILAGRPERRGRVERQERDGRSLVLVVDAGPGLDPGAVPIPALTALSEY